MRTKGGTVVVPHVEQDGAAPGQPQHRPSMREVALAAGVSKAAVSKVIRDAYGVSPEMRERVTNAIRELGYRPRIAARAMRGASWTIGIEIPQLGNDFFTQVMQGAADALSGSPYQLIIAPSSGEHRGAAVLDALVDRQVDGLIAISPEVPPAGLERLAEQVPMVLLGRHDASERYDTVSNDDTKGAALVMHHLLALGHRRIAHLTVGAAPEVPPALLPHTLRSETYTRTMLDHDLTPVVRVCGPLEPDAHLAARQLLEGDDPPSAIFAANDTLAVGALRARMELGLSASELAIAGYDDIDVAAHPIMSLTTVDQFGRASGADAVRLLLERIQQGRTTPTHEVIEPELRVRHSTVPPAHHTRGLGMEPSCTASR